MRLRGIVFNLHLVAGLAAAAFALVLGLTGSVMAFEDELDHVTHPRLFAVAPTGASLPLAELGARAAAAFPERRITGYGIGVSPDLSSYVAMQGIAVYLDPYTGEILGTRSGPTWLGQVHQLHLRLLSGGTGQTIVAWSGLALVLLSCSGLYLWWPIKRVGVNWAQGGRRRWFDVHNAVGIACWILILLLSVTGSVIGFENATTPLFYRVTGSKPIAPPAAVTPVPGARLITPDAALAVARAAMPGAAPIAVSVAGPKTAYRVALRYPEDRTPGGRTRVFVDPYTGAVLQAESSRTTAAGARLVNANRAIHTGDLFGIPTKILMSLGSLAVVGQAISGAAMWLKRVRR
jgi:uncharacterized iron-regulated membrane protein